MDALIDDASLGLSGEYQTESLHTVHSFLNVSLSFYFLFEIFNKIIGQLFINKLTASKFPGYEVLSTNQNVA